MDVPTRLGAQCCLMCTCCTSGRIGGIWFKALHIILVFAGDLLLMLFSFLKSARKVSRTAMIMDVVGHAYIAQFV